VGRVTLTFDNGPDPVGTPLVLEVLRRHRLTATFFVLGRQLDAPGGLDLARRVVSEGHRLGHHGYSHETPLGLDRRPDAVALELERTQALLERVDSGERLFRPFGGGGRLGPHLLSVDAARWLEARRFTCVLWNSVPGDWADPDGWVASALADLDRLEHALVVLHDVVPAAMAHLDRFLGETRERGHRFEATFPEDCLPLVRGRRRPGLSTFIAPPPREEITA
jgi:peptidoglycan/xylan/chitin deacetylase (PgdA/CDA1 family)